MIRARREGLPIQNGFNFYPLGDAYSVGFVARAWKWALMVRWSKVCRKMIVKWIET